MTSTRGLAAAVSAAALVALHTGCSAQSTERQGGGDLPGLTAGSAALAGNAGMMSGDSGASGAPAGGAAGLSGAGPVPWCKAYKIINCVCQQCHQAQPINGAPISLMTYDDTQAPFPSKTSTNHVWNSMQSTVSVRAMPYTGDPNVKPPVKPLSDADQSTLLTWLTEGAHAEGGTACPMTCDWSDGTPGL